MGDRKSTSRGNWRRAILVENKNDFEHLYQTKTGIWKEENVELHNSRKCLYRMRTSAARQFSVVKHNNEPEDIHRAVRLQNFVSSLEGELQTLYNADGRGKRVQCLKLKRPNQH
jgi:Zn ribbon nucleic-acid-binding protein